MPLNHILRKRTGGYKLTKSREKINHQMYMMTSNCLPKVKKKKKKELETLIHTIRIYSKDIGMEFTIEKCAMLVMKSEK